MQIMVVKLRKIQPILICIKFSQLMLKESYGNQRRRGLLKVPYRELKQSTTATATRTSPIKRFHEQNNSCARAV